MNLLFFCLISLTLIWESGKIYCGVVHRNPVKRSNDLIGEISMINMTMVNDKCGTKDYKLSFKIIQKETLANKALEKLMGKIMEVVKSSSILETIPFSTTSEGKLLLSSRFLTKNDYDNFIEFAKGKDFPQGEIDGFIIKLLKHMMPNVYMKSYFLCNHDFEFHNVMNYGRSSKLMIPYKVGFLFDDLIDKVTEVYINALEYSKGENDTVTLTAIERFVDKICGFLDKDVELTVTDFNCENFKNFYNRALLNNNFQLVLEFFINYLKKGKNTGNLILKKFFQITISGVQNEIDNRKFIEDLTNSTNELKFKGYKVIEPCEIYEFLDKVYGVWMNLNSIKDGLTYKNDHYFDALFDDFCFKDTLVDLNSKKEFLTKTNIFIETIGKNYDKISKETLKINLCYEHTDRFEIQKRIDEDQRLICEVLHSDHKECFYMIYDPNGGKKAYSYRGTKSPCDNTICEIRYPKEIVSELKCSTSDYIKLNTIYDKSLSEHVNRKSKVINKVYGSHLKCWQPMDLLRDYICFDKRCTINVKLDFDRIIITFYSEGAKKINLNINGVSEYVEEFNPGNTIKERLIDRQGKFKLLIRCNSELIERMLVRTLDSYCNEYALAQWFGKFSKSWCINSERFFNLGFKLIAFVMSYFLVKIISYILSTVTSVVMFLPYSFLSYLFQCKICSRFRIGCGMCKCCFKAHNCRSCGVCSRTIYIDTETGTFIHDCEKRRKLGPLCDYIQLANKFEWYFSKICKFILSILIILICLDIMMIMVPVVSADDEFIDKKSLIDSGFESYASRIDERIVRKTIGISSTEEINSQVFVNLLLTMVVRPGENSGVKFIHNAIEHHLDFRVDSTVRYTTIKYLYTTCNSEQKAMNTYSCYGDKSWCKKTLTSNFNKTMDKKSLYTVKPYYEELQGVGSWYCGCVTHNYGVACAICYPHMDMTNCVDVYKGVENNVKVKICFYFEGSSYCKDFVGDLIFSKDSIGVLITSTIRDRDVGKIFAIKDSDKGSIRSGVINDRGSFLNAFGNVQFVKPLNIINWYPDVNSFHICNSNSAPVQKIQKCYNNNYELFEHLNIEPLKKLRGTNTIETFGENLGFSTIKFRIQINKVKMINDDGKIDKFEIKKTSGCYNCKEGSKICFFIVARKSGNYIINCQPSLLRSIQNLKTDQTEYCYGMISNVKYFNVKCQILNMKVEFDVNLDEPTDKFIDFKNDVESHTVMKDSTCDDWFRCNVFDFSKLNLQSFFYNFFPKLILVVFGCIVLIIILYYFTKLLMNLCSRRGRIVLRNFYYNLEVDKLQNRMEIVRSTKEYKKADNAKREQMLEYLRTNLSRVRDKIVELDSLV